MSVLLIGWPNRIDAAALSGGSWSVDVPLANVATRDKWRVARTVDAALASSVLRADFGVERRVRVVALAAHNLSRDARWRVRVGTVPGGYDCYAGPWEAVWALTWDADMLEWESAAYWDGVQDPTDYLGHPYAAICVLPETVVGRYLSVEIDDTGNDAGYIQLGRVFAGGGFTPHYGAEYGLTDAWIDPSDVTEAESGVVLGVPRRRRRQVKFSMPLLSHGEADLYHELARQQGVLGEVLYVPDCTDRQRSQRYGFLGRMAELSPIEWPWPRRRSVPVQIKED